MLLLRLSVRTLSEPRSALFFNKDLCKFAQCLHTSAIISGKKEEKERKYQFDRKSARKFAQRLYLEERANLLECLQKLEQAHLPPNPVPEETQAPEGPQQPTSSALYHLAFQQSLPFIGFGFLDNLIMILAGEYIDHTIGLTLGISTMAAAALGNTVSDMFGIGSAWYVERMASKLGVTPPPLTLEQLDMPVCRIASTAGRGIGVSIGCILGMFPLLFQ